MEALKLEPGVSYPATVTWDLRVSPTRWSSSDNAVADVVVVPDPDEQARKAQVQEREAARARGEDVGEEPHVEAHHDMQTTALITAAASGSPALRTCEIRAHATVEDEASEFNGQELVAVFLVAALPMGLGGDIAVTDPTPPPDPPITARRYQRGAPERAWNPEKPQQAQAAE